MVKGTTDLELTPYVESILGNRHRKRVAPIKTAYLVLANWYSDGHRFALLNMSSRNAITILVFVFGTAAVSSSLSELVI